MKDLPVTTRPCIRSGFCCKKGPCPYGEQDKETGWCVHLEEAGRIGEAPLYRCAIYSEIKKKPGWEFSPAFGAGCSSTLFNDDRDLIFSEMRRLLG